MTLINIFILIYLFQDVVWCIDDQCINYHTLSRDNERSKDYVTPGGLSSIPCDDIADGWYRFGTGDIATSCVPTNHCGTSSTVWMKDPVPNIGETRVNEFCVNHQAGSSSKPCCLFSININVTNCDGFMVYYFRKGELLCPSGYCRGDLKPCPNGATSVNGYQPCTASYPPMLGPPVLSPPQIVSDGHDFIQTCTVNYNASEPDAAFDLTWYFDGQVYKNITLVNGVLNDTLTSQDWKGHIGKKLSCSAVPYFKSKSTRGKVQISSQYLGAITISPKPITLIEGEEVDITLTSTLPTVCSKTSMASCKMELLMTVKTGNPDHIFSKGSCRVVLKTTDWNSVTNKAVSVATLSTVIDTVVKPSAVYNIAYRVLPDILGHSIWDTYDMEGVNITVHDAPHEVCMLIGDPQIIGIYNKDLYMEYSPGDLLMYDSSHDQKNELTVVTRLWSPSKDASSVCAVGVAYDDTLIKVDMCNNNIGKSGPLLTRAGKNPDEIEVYMCGSEYEIVTGDGVRVSIVSHDLNLDVKLHLPPKFRGKSNGLCTYNGTHSASHSRYWNLYQPQVRTSILQYGAQRYTKLQQAPSDPSNWFCDCGVLSGGCNAFERVKYPRSPIALDSTGKTVTRTGCRHAFPRALVFHNGKYYGDYTHITLQQAPIGSLATQIENTCREYLQNYSSPFCLNQNAENIDTFVQACKNDHRGSGTYNYIDSAIQGFQWSCEENILLNASHYSVKSHGKMAPPAEVTSEVCPNFCSKSGTCTNGTCICDPGRFGSDCSVSKTSPPEVLSVIGGTTCTMFHQSCTTPTLVVKNVIDSLYLRAKLTLLEIHYGRPVPTNKSFEIPAVFENRYSVSVPLSAFIKTLKDQTAFRIDIQLTDDGHNYTKPVQYFVFDERCHYCNVLLGGCYEKENACRIDGRCYASAEKNPSIADEVCDPTNAIMSWTKVANANPLIIG